MKIKVLSPLCIIAVSLLFFSCTEEESASAPVEPDTADSARVSQTVGYLENFEGLHVTGSPIDIDIETYRLQITGAVQQDLSLTFDEIKGYEPVTMEIALNCPGFFTDTGVWTGVPVTLLLKEAGIDPHASLVTFISYDDSYSQTLPIGRVLEGDILVGYQFDEKEFHRVHGFPLRICAPGEAGAVWVKWLGKIRVE